MFYFIYMLVLLVLLLQQVIYSQAWSPVITNYVFQKLTLGSCIDNSHSLPFAEVPEPAAAEWCAAAYNAIYQPSPEKVADDATSLSTSPNGCSALPSQQQGLVMYNTRSAANRCGSDYGSQGDTFECLCIIKKYILHREDSKPCSDINGYEDITTEAECIKAFRSVEEKDHTSVQPSKQHRPIICAVYSTSSAVYFNGCAGKNNMICLCRRKAPSCICNNGTAADANNCTSPNEENCLYCNDGYHLQTMVGGTKKKCVENVCDCENGEAPRGIDCPMHDTEMCSFCTNIPSIVSPDSGVENDGNCSGLLIPDSSSSITGSSSFKFPVGVQCMPVCKAGYRLHGVVSCQSKSDKDEVVMETATCKPYKFSSFVQVQDGRCDDPGSSLEYVTDARECGLAQVQYYRSDSVKSIEYTTLPYGCVTSDSPYFHTLYLNKPSHPNDDTKCNNAKNCLCINTGFFKRVQSQYCSSANGYTFITDPAECVAAKLQLIDNGIGNSEGPSGCFYTQAFGGYRSYLQPVRPNSLDCSPGKTCLCKKWSDIDLNDGNSTNVECTSIADENKRDCGYKGITASECKQKGCCYIPSDNRGGADLPWCFYTQSFAPSPSSPSLPTPPPPASPTPANTGPSPTTPIIAPPPSPSASITSMPPSPSVTVTNISPSPTTELPSSQTGPTGPTGPPHNKKSVTLIDPRLNEMKIKTRNSVARIRQLITVQGKETLTFIGREFVSSVKKESSSFNYFLGTTVRIGSIYVLPKVHSNGLSMTVELPSYEEMCEPNCQDDGMYVNVEIKVPVNSTSLSSGKIQCMAKVMESAKKDSMKQKTWCTATCGENDFSGCPKNQGGLWLMRNTCEDYSTDEKICLNERTADQCAYQAAAPPSSSSSKDEPPICFKCPSSALCPGGQRMWPKVGYWKLKEKEVDKLPIECPAPSKERCIGWDASTGSTKCGKGYAHGTYLCSSCADGYFQTISDRKCQSCSSVIVDHTKSNTTNGKNKKYGGGSSEEVGWALLAFGFVVLMLTVLVFVIACRTGGDRSTGLSRASSFLFYSLVSLQLIAQCGQHATGFEDPVVLRLYWWLSVMSTIDTANSIPTECLSDPPFFWSNMTMAVSLGLLVVWLIWIFLPKCRFENMCFKCIPKLFGLLFHNVEDTIRKRVTPQLRRYLLSCMILVYAVVAKSSVGAIHCIDNGNGTLVLAKNARVECWVNEHHFFNGTLGWITLVAYCLGFPLFCLLLVTTAPWFDHEAKVGGGHHFHKKKHRQAKLAVSINNKKEHNQRGSVVQNFMTAGEIEREKTKKKTMHIKGHHRRLSSTGAIKEVTSSCCAIHDLGTIRERQRSSVLSFVFHRPTIYISYKPLIECDYHINHLYFRPGYLILLLVLLSLSIIPKSHALFRLIVGVVFLLLYIGANFILKPMRRTRNWKLPVKLLIVIIGMLSLSLNYTSSLLDKNGEHLHSPIRVLSMLLVILTGVLICVVIPLSAVYELWVGAKREKKCQLLREKYMARRNRKNVAGSFHFNNAAGGVGPNEVPTWDDMAIMAADDLEELEDLVYVLKANDKAVANGGGADELNLSSRGIELARINSLPRMTLNPMQLEREAKAACAAIEREGFSENPIAVYGGNVSLKALAESTSSRRQSAPGWEIHADDETGSNYYFNPRSRVSVWSVEETWMDLDVNLLVPANSDGSSQLRVSPGWEIHADDETGSNYYFNPRSRVSVWSVEETWMDSDVNLLVPANSKAISQSSSSSSASSGSSSEEEEEEGLPEIVVPLPTPKNAGRSRLGKKKIRTMTHKLKDKPSELSDIRRRILDKIAATSASHQGYHHRKDSSELKSNDVGGIEINDRRGDWMMIHDDISNKTVYYNYKTNVLRETKPKGWVKMLTEHFSRK